MPTEDENVKFLYLILTMNGPPTIDWDQVGAALDLKKGAVTKRWSRLQKAMRDGHTAGPSAHELLWLCVKHSESAKTQPFDWKVIAEACNTTPGAASKRFSRLKQAQNAGATFPKDFGTTSEPPTPKGKSAGRANGTPKRKRGADANVDANEGDADAVTSPGQENAEPGLDEDNKDNQTVTPTPKRNKMAASQVKPAAKLKAEGAAKFPKAKKEVVEKNDKEGQQDVVKQEVLDYPVDQNSVFGDTASNEYDVYSAYGRLAGYNGAADSERKMLGDIV